MQAPKDNIFTSFRGPDARDDENLGKQLEDNTTKALLHVLDFGDDKIVQAILSVLTAGTDTASQIGDVSATDVITETQVQIQDINQNKELVFVGVSDTGFDPRSTENDPDTISEDDTSKRRVDGVIYVGDELTIAEESKFDGAELHLSDTALYKETLSIPNSQYTTISWLDIYQELERVLGDPPLTAAISEAATDRPTFLAEEFMRYLQIYGLKLGSSESTYDWENDPGVNTVTLEFRPSMKVTTDLADPPVEYAVHFDTAGATGYQDFYASEGEWLALLNNLDSTIREHLRKGDADGFFEYVDEECNRSGREKISKIGTYDTGRKWAQVVSKDGHYVLGFKRASPGRDEAPGGYFMLGPGELRDHFGGGPDTDPTGFQLLFADDPDIRALR